MVNGVVCKTIIREFDSHPPLKKLKKKLDTYYVSFVHCDINNKGNIMNTKEIIVLLESIDQYINDGNLDDAQVEIAINLRTLYKELVKK